MTQAQGMTGFTGSKKSGRLGNMLLALAWEECRVGGLLAAWTSLIAVVVLNWFRFSLGIDAMTRLPEFLPSVVVGVPFLIAFFLVLNTNNSGQLVGGFSSRVLRLPVSIRASVAVALIARTLFVSCSSVLIVITSQMLFLDSPGFVVAGLAVLFYLTAQGFDWLRTAIAGLSSLVMLICAVMAIVFVRNEVWFDDAQSEWVNPLVVLACVVFVYGISVPAVHATRIGRRVGIPEIWEWPNRASFLWPARHKAFSSPMAAQIWCEFRRSAAWLPGVMIGSWLLMYVGSWLIADQGNPDDISVHEVLRAVLPFLSLMFAAIIQGLSARMVRFRTNAGNADYSFLLPLTSSQLATAQMAAVGLVFVPTLALATAGHFYGTPVFAMVYDGLQSGATSLREAVWILMSRGLLVGVFAWPLLAVKTGFFPRTIGVVLTGVVGVITWYVWSGSKDPLVVEALVLGLMIGFIGLTAGSYVYALRKKVITTSALVTWGIAWALIAWLLVQTMWEFESERSILSALVTLIAGLACAALIPLPYIAVVLDIARQRHGVSHPQDESQHEHYSRDSGGGHTRTILRVGAVGGIVFAIWLGWPARPSYEALWRSKGFPATFAELDAWYEAVPDESNAALEYVAVAKVQMEAYARRYDRLEQENAALFRRGEEAIRRDNSLIVGGGDVDRAEAIPPEIWAETEAYWGEVTSEIAPLLKEISAKGSRSSRYPIDLRQGYDAELDHLSRLRAMSRELYVDALHWAVAGDTANAAESLIAMVPIVDSLSNEPTLISQLVRFAIEGIFVRAIEDVMNRATFTEDQLARLQHAMRDAARMPDGLSPMDRAFVGESLFFFGQVGTGDANIFGVAGIQASDEISAEFLRTPFYALLFPVAAERMIAAQIYGEIIDRGSEPDMESLRLSSRGDFVWHEQEILFIAPMAYLTTPPMYRARDAEWRARMLFQTARTAIAVERYRLANDHLPDDLDALVPAFLEQIPTDFYAGDEPLRYRQRETGEYVVYSIGRNGTDDLGVEVNRAYWDGDITFTVAPRAGFN